LGELVQRVASVLAAGDVRAPNGRVTGLPDGRVIRWYTTIGLVDRPAGMRGRTALYGRRHLLQLVAVKRRQAEGLALAEIQAELAGATDATLHRIAGIADLPDVSDVAAIGRRFWKEAPTVTVTVKREEQETLSGVRLAGGAVLLLPANPDADDIAEIRSAARPLLELLATRGLLMREGER
jgi:DNA-binding transcriptional MerR regulator